MSKKERKKIYRKNRKYLNFTVCFLFFLGFIFILNIYTKDKDFSESENRFLSQRPKFSVDNLIEGRFTSKFEDYLADQFIGRDFFIKIKTTTDRLLGKRESNEVFLGKDKHLIENFTKPDKKYVEENLKAINSFSYRYYDKNQYMIIAPTAVSILNDKLPLFAPTLDQNQYLKEYQSKLNSKINFVNTYETLSSHKDEYIYYKTDHHWTSLGAKYAYEELAKAMKLQERNDYYTTQLVSNSFVGSLSSKSGYNLKTSDKVNIYLPKDNTEKIVVNYVEEQEKTASLYNSDALNKKDNYEVFLKGNHPLVKIKTNTDNDKTLLIFKDSYANSFVPFLIKDFKNIIMVDSRYYYDDIDKLIKNENVSDILYLYNANTFFSDTSLSLVLNNE